MALTMAEVARDYETDGVPSSGSHKIKKSNLRNWGAWVEGLINAFTANGGLIYASKALLDADLAHAANSMAWVIGDATVANNGVYGKVGASGTGSWTRRSDLPFSFIIASDAGAGTANAIQATTSIPVSSSALVWMNIFEANTATPVTVSFNGGSALTIKTNSGNNVAVGGLTAGMIVLGIVSGSTFRLVSDQASAAVVAAAEAAQAAAEAAAVSVNIKYAATRTALKGYNTAVTSLAFLGEAGREGLFEWTAGDFSTQVAADTLEGVHVKADAVAASSGAWVRVGAPTVYHFGGSATSSSVAAIDAMEALLGYVRFPTGKTLIGANVTIEVPIYFDEGAYIETQSTFTTTIRDEVNAPRQYIFQGAGSYSLEHNGTDGETARYSHVSWFGAFPGDAAVDSGVFLQKLTNSMGTTREADIEFDVGTYYQHTKVTWQRASKVRGKGDRLTNIWAKGAIATSGDVWDTADVGCNFHDFQFNSDSARTSGAYIRLLHDRCEAYDILMDKAFEGIVLKGNECEAHRIKGLTAATGAGSATIKVHGNDALVSVVNFTNATNGPEYVVAVVPDGTSVNRPRIRDIFAQTSQNGVGIINSGSPVNGPDIDGVKLHAGLWAVKILHSITGNASVYAISNVVALDSTSGAVDVEMSSTGHIFGMRIANISSRLATDTGIKVNVASTGVVKGLSIGNHEITSAAINGVYVNGAGSPCDIVSISNGTCRACVDGYELKATRLTGSALLAADGTNGFIISSGTTFWSIQGVANGNSGANKTDSSGAVTKNDAILV